MLKLGFDPGRDKCGLALVEEKGNIITQSIVSSQVVINTIRNLLAEHQIDEIVMGNQTTSQQWREQLKTEFPQTPIIMVDERNSTLEARERYWKYYPPRGLMRLIPQGMRVPPRPIDDIVAILLVERSINIE